MNFPGGSTVVLLKRQKTGTDGYGNDVYETVPVGEPLKGAFAPGGSAEYTSGMAQVVTQPTLYLAEVLDVTAIDALSIDGVVFEADGDPLVWRNPFTGWTGGTQIPLRKVTG